MFSPLYFLRAGYNFPRRELKIKNIVHIYLMSVENMYGYFFAALIRFAIVEFSVFLHDIYGEGLYFWVGYPIFAYT
jgi:hypothetical protein